MKKIIALIICAIALFSLASCTALNRAVERLKDAAVSAISGRKEFARGTVADGRYVGGSSGIVFAAPDGWTFLDDEELAKQSGMTKELFKDEELAKKIDDNAIYDMVAASEDQLLNVNIVFNSTESSVRGITEDEYVDKAIPTVKDAMASLDVADLKCEKAQITFLGETHTGIRTSYTYKTNGVGAYQAQAIVLSGDYPYTVTVTSFFEDRTDELLALFTKQED